MFSLSKSPLSSSMIFSSSDSCCEKVDLELEEKKAPVISKLNASPPHDTIKTSVFRFDGTLQ